MIKICYAYSKEADSAMNLQIPYVLFSHYRIRKDLYQFIRTFTKIGIIDQQFSGRIDFHQRQT